MAAFVASCGHRPRLVPALVWLVIAAGAFAPGGAARAADSMPGSTMGKPLTVHLDQAQVIKLPDRTATLVVGNPLIADAAVQPGGVAVITAKSHGVTNLIALDRTGVKLLEHAVQVRAPVDSTVVVYRGIERESYSCSPVCERRITLGDTQNYFNATLNQAGNLSALAQGGQPK